ncbi:MAG: AAA family ATPase [Alphaproteobacteria bacterium]|jgi:cellulose biosynthesis protein BcsQ|nr:AAA family ATPase [Alphaproteobacteria bacterium]
MVKVISFFNHKGGVGKTTTVHNIGYGLAMLGKKVLLIDADPQMNLTAAVYGLSTDAYYGNGEESLWREYNEKYTSLYSCLRQILIKEPKEVIFYNYNNSQDNSGVSFDLLRGSIEINSLDADLMGIIQNRNTITRDYFSSLGGELNKIYKNYDFVLIDQSPSAASIINAIFSLTADFVIIPSTPTFFCLQAVNNLTDIWQNWYELLSLYASTINTKGIDLKSKFLGIIIQQGKRYKGGNATHTEEWKEIVNNGIKSFTQSLLSKSVSEKEFQQVFSEDNKSKPYIIATYNNFTDKLRSICDNKGLPIVALTKEDLPTESSSDDTNKQYLKSWESIQSTNSYICESLLKLAELKV